MCDTWEASVRQVLTPSNAEACGMDSTGWSLAWIEQQRLAEMFHEGDT